MTHQAQSPQVLEVALAPALDDGHDVIRIPEAPSVEPLEPPPRQKPFPVRPSGPFQIEVRDASVRVAKRANPPVPGEYMVAEISRIGAQPPFMHAPVRTKGEAAGGHLEIAPAAQGPAVQALGYGRAVGTPAGHGSGSTHALSYCSFVEVRSPSNSIKSVKASCPYPPVNSPPVHPGSTIWLTGMSGAGKSTASLLLAQRLRARGCKVEVLDGDACAHESFQGT